MTPEVQQTIIAEACGWKACMCHGETGCGRWFSPEETDYKLYPQHETAPDYLHDLNAMHGAAEQLARKHGWDYGAHFVNGRWSCGFYSPKGCSAPSGEVAHVYDPKQVTALAKAFLLALEYLQKQTNETIRNPQS